MARRALIVFDIDGTLLQAHRITVPAVQRTCAELGLPVPDSGVIMSYVGRPVEEYEAWLAQQATDGLGEQLVAAANARELALIADEGALYPGAIDALDELSQAGYVLACCSNGPTDYVSEAVRAFALSQRFEMLLCRGMGYPGKKEMVAHILARWNLPNNPAEEGPYRAIVVGDRADDVEAAYLNGALSIGATYGFGAQGELDRADIRVPEASAIPAAVYSLLGW